MSEQNPGAASLAQKADAEYAKAISRVSDCKPPEAFQIRAIDAGELLTMQLPPRKNLIAPFLPEQGVIQVYGPRGIGKTQQHMGLGVGGACGRSPLSCWTIERPFGVLYIDGELPASVMQERLAEAIARAGMSPIAPLRIVTPDLQSGGTMNIADERWQRALEPHLEGIDCIIADSITTLVLTDRGENESESATETQAWNLRMRASGRTVVWGHHSGKNGQQRGTSKREDILDTVIRMEKPSDYLESEGCRAELHFTKHRAFHGADAEPIEILLTPQGWTWRKVSESVDRRIRQLKDDGLSVRDIAQEIGLSKTAVHRRLQGEGGAS